MSREILTVAVCTHNRGAALRRCLEAIAAQTRDPALFKVIVIDNASTDDTAAVVAAAQRASPALAYVHEPNLGLAKARNRALALCQTQLLAFTDDDALPHADWVETILRSFQDLPDHFAAVGGEIEPIWETERPPWLEDEMLRPMSARLGWDIVPRELLAHEWICEVNCAYRTSVLEKYHGFPESLGRSAYWLVSSENYINTHMYQDGYRFYFNPSMRVAHVIPASKATRTWLKRRYFWQGVSEALCAAFDVSAGRSPSYKTEFDLPGSAREWRLLGDHNATAVELRRSLELSHSVGYLLGLKDIIHGR